MSASRQRHRVAEGVRERAAWQRVLEAAPPAGIDGAIDLARLVRRRSRNERVRILPAFDGRTADDPRVRHGGAHAAIHHGAGIGRPEQRDVYISAQDAEAFRSDYRADLFADDPNVVLRIIQDPIDVDDQFRPPIVAVLDLLDAADTRAAAEAIRLVQ